MAPYEIKSTSLLSCDNMLLTALGTPRNAGPIFMILLHMHQAADPACPLPQPNARNKSHHMQLCYAQFNLSQTSAAQLLCVQEFHPSSIYIKNHTAKLAHQAWNIPISALANSMIIIIIKLYLCSESRIISNHRLPCTYMFDLLVSNQAQMAK